MWINVNPSKKKILSEEKLQNIEEKKNWKYKHQIYNGGLLLGKRVKK